ncbi:helix-turn-helix transcriptional regulator [Legionella bozemanae]|uniref:HTH luxR-type domain-containing protein n=1 Tax=Legionella bozemanae TaxID=447 RepID=A0A0W0RY09_LEGBO|nr:helix-turn-helix domain-containing protein [Legionella bozemanae]KTC75928.1 hypothetical protein Lboz_0756 [Legionella bozemanae]STO35446.1 DNA-binding transcriptional activator SdiA [Legionella bozemanae]
MKNTQTIKEMIALSTGIQSYCIPLKEIGFHTFTVLINFDNNSQINLSNRPQWINDYYELKLYESSIFDTNPTLFNSGVSIWPQDSHLPVFQHGLLHFDSGQGITICHRAIDYTAFYFFSGSKKNAGLLNVIINNLTFFEDFINYFTREADHIISSAFSLKFSRIQKENNNILSDSFILNNLNKYNKCQLRIQEIRKKITDKPTPFNSELSLRQKQVLFWYAKGKTAKQTAKILGLSPRTVERHFEEIRKKKGNKNKQEILNEFLRLSYEGRLEF